MADIHFPPRELAVMSVLWKLGSASVGEVREALDEALAYTSVLSALQTLEEKGYVRHESEGRAYRHFPVIPDERVRREEVLVRLARLLLVPCLRNLRYPAVHRVHRRLRRRMQSQRVVMASRPRS